MMWSVKITPTVMFPSQWKTLRKHGLSAQPIQSAVRIASVVHAVAVALEQAKAAG